ncbi:hypothetical protein [Dictyobacter formicarum]|uniref:Uncharacterized protein n=1 Tax=Dictyobacter formicarum TaxID=2778368 RepID=A0ABQ3VQV8_9CHLR|nr:hypothetical protein [Dictyobacter formicarum]GHO88200.1 hypothetical protein KSZ_62060 [Dictyobacter formicarum]
MSSIMGLTPRSALRHRPINNAFTDIPPWVRASQALQQPRPHHQFPGQAVLLHFQTRFPSASLATLVSLGMVIMLLLILIGQGIASWTSTVVTDWQYGRPRTFQTDAFVGHEQTGQPSHFVALNVRGQVEVLELPSNDPSRARLILGPHLSGPQADLIPVTIHFVPSSTPHAPNMRLDIGSTSILFYNTHGQFQAHI